MLKEWILGLEFVKDELNVKYHKGYSWGKNETPPIDIDQIVSERISSLLGTVDERKVIRTDSNKGFIFLGDEMLDPSTVHNLRQEAELMDKLELWHLMINTIRATAHKKVFVDSKDLTDVLAGKMALYNLDLMKKILTVFLGK